MGTEGRRCGVIAFLVGFASFAAGVIALAVFVILLEEWIGG